MAPYFFNISVVFSMGSASTVCPRPVIVVARNKELYTASSVDSITARNSGDIAVLQFPGDFNRGVAQTRGT